MTLTLPDPGELLTGVWTEVLILGLIFVLRLLGVDLFPKILLVFHSITSLFRRMLGRRRVLVYTDCDDRGTAVENMREALRDVLGPSRIDVVAIHNPERLLQYRLSPAEVHSVVLLLTDVTTLSTSLRIRSKIQHRLVRYSQRGGLLLLGHDALYRRSRNEELQKLAGGRIVDFQQTEEPIPYRINPELGHILGGVFAPLEHALPSAPVLDDGEFVCGEWNPDVVPIYTAEAVFGGQKVTIPVVTYRTAGKGAVCWLHSADHKPHGGPQPIAGPDPVFIDILQALLLHARPPSGWRSRRNLERNRQAEALKSRSGDEPGLAAQEPGSSPKSSVTQS